MNSVDQFVEYYIKDEETEKLRDLLDRLGQLSQGTNEGSFKGIGSSYLELKADSLLEFKSVRKYEIRQDTHKELKMNKIIKISGHNEIIFNIHNSQIADLFWFNDRHDALLKRMCFNMSRYLEFEGNKRFILSFSDTEMDAIYHNRGYQYLLSVSDSMALDFCSRKLVVVKKNFEDLGTRQKFSSLKAELTLSIPLTATQRAVMSKINEKSNDSARDDRLSIYASNLNQKGDSLNETPQLSNAKFNFSNKDHSPLKYTVNESVTSRTSSEGHMKESERAMHIDSMDAMESSKKKTEADENLEKHFEFVFDILGHYFGIEDKISTGCNVGMIVKDWSYPVDCICLLGDRGVYIKTNYMIKYEGENENVTKSLINLMGRPELRNYNQGKYYLDLTEMTRPYLRDSLTMNKYRKQQGESFDKMYHIRYEDITEIHAKHYMGKRAIGLEFWTVQRRPRLFIFNIHQIETIWRIIVENWIRVTNNSRENIVDVEKNLMIGLGDKVFFLVKMVDELGVQSRLVIKYFDDQALVSKMKRKWEQGFLDNFSYLMILNACGGRSLKFMSCYYIFPQVIKCYSDFLKKKEGSMRNLSRPMPVTRLDSVDHFDHMKLKYECEKFHHGNFYSNKNILEHYLFRVMPYTQYQYDLNDGKLDDRMFFDFESNFKYCSGDGSSFEMIPENYYLDYYLLNLNNLDFKNDKFDNVVMPEWASMNPRYFNLVMREALESPYVNRSLCKWIDLIFGSAQQGPKAIEQFNLYMTGCSVIIDPSRNILPSSSSTLDSNRYTKQLNAQINMQYNMGQTPGVLFYEDHPEKRLSFDPEHSSAVHALISKLGIMSNLVTIINPDIEQLNSSSSIEQRNFNQLVINDSEFRTFGPVGYLMKKLRVIKNRKFKINEHSDMVYLLTQNSFLIGQNMIGLVGKDTEFMCLTQTSAHVGYLNCYDITCYEYDCYNNILWVGNSLGELFGYSATFANNIDLNKTTGEKGKGLSDGFSCFRDSKQIPLTYISDNTDSKIIQNLFRTFTSNKGYPKMKPFYLYFFQMSSNGYMKTDSSLFECKQTLTSLTQDFHFATEGGKLEMIKSSHLSNIVFAVNYCSTITIWDIYDKCILVRLHPPHFTQVILLQNFDEKRRVDFRKFLNKDFASIQKPVAVSISPNNEDFAIISQDYVSVYSCSGVLIANERTTNKQDRFTSVCIVQKLFTVEDHIVLVGDASGTLSIYQLREKQSTTDSPKNFTFWSPGLNRKESTESNTTPTYFKKTVLEFTSPVLESEKRVFSDDDKKTNKDPKYAFGYFINRNRYYKQSNPLFMLELIGTKPIMKDKAIKDIKINRAQTRIYVLLSDGTARFL